MRILLLGYGKEGQAAEKYFSAKYPEAEFEVWQDFDFEEISQRDYSSYDIILRSPSVPPIGKGETSLTRYFLENCPCPIIGVTATKGKGTTCSFIKAILDAAGEDAYLVGNIGTPAIEVLDNLQPGSVVVYEMSSFQLWDVEKSPHVTVVGMIEPDHLNVHRDFDEYVGAKANICRYQGADDFTVYFKDNPESVKIAKNSKGTLVPYPFEVPAEVAQAVKLPGKHNLDNAVAAIAAVACYKNISPDEYLNTSLSEICAGLADFKGLPHRLEFVREIDGVRWYDDNFSTNPASTKVAVEAFPDDKVILIAGGRDKTDFEDLPEVYEALMAKNVAKVILIGESGHEIMKRWPEDKFEVAESLEEAVKLADQSASSNSANVVIMSPAAASFDMFENVYDRGNKYQKLLERLF
ncbi:UDP-N-acetylmuramoyl-L-alanine--D-glutamate ligase [Candidatus Saccharibacteria bacterium]|nr:UDP-N-acetylmuramoyl-L-alanine--D-glutamate ligase [Candidatus Saccharibacteria bacterium]